MNDLSNAATNFDTNGVRNSDDTSYPQALPLSRKEKVNLRWSNTLISVISAALWFNFLIAIPGYTAAINLRWTQVQNSATEMTLFLLLMIVCLLILAVVVWITTVVLKNGFSDSKAGIKHVGIAELISKELIFGTDGDETNYYVVLKWTANRREETVEIDHHELYKKLSKGDLIYLELLPNSKKVLSYRTV